MVPGRASDLALGRWEMRHPRSFDLATVLLLAAAGMSEAASLQCLSPLRPAFGSASGVVFALADPETIHD